MRAKANYIDPEQFQRIIDEIPYLALRKWTTVDVEYLFKITYWCGLRMNESVRLKKEDFDLLSNEVFLGKTKKKKNDFAPIPDPFVSELKQYISMKKKVRIFTIL